MLVTIQTRRGNLLQVPEYRFESWTDYKPSRVINLKESISRMALRR
jgi:hypothetical protein